MNTYLEATDVKLTFPCHYDNFIGTVGKCMLHINCSICHAEYNLVWPTGIHGLYPLFVKTNQPSREMSKAWILGANSHEQAAILSDIVSERRRQDDKFGKQDFRSITHMIAVLGEEYGEACNAALEYIYNAERQPYAAKIPDLTTAVTNVEKELTQVAAVAVAMREMIKRRGVMVHESDETNS